MLACVWLGPADPMCEVVCVSLTASVALLQGILWSPRSAILPPVDGHLGCFLVLVVMHKTAIIILGLVFFVDVCAFLLG